MKLQIKIVIPLLDGKLVIAQDTSNKCPRTLESHPRLNMLRPRNKKKVKVDTMKDNPPLPPSPTIKLHRKRPPVHFVQFSEISVPARTSISPPMSIPAGEKTPEKTWSVYSRSPRTSVSPHIFYPSQPENSRKDLVRLVELSSYIRKFSRCIPTTTPKRIGLVHITACYSYHRGSPVLEYLCYESSSDAPSCDLCDRSRTCRHVRSLCLDSQISLRLLGGCVSSCAVADQRGGR